MILYVYFIKIINSSLERKFRRRLEQEQRSQEDNVVNKKRNGISLIIGSDSNDFEEGEDFNDIQEV